MLNEKLKKEFQKMVGAIRADINSQLAHKAEIPKAMLTKRQAAKNTATINCDASLEIAKTVLAHPLLTEFAHKHNATCAIESVSYGYYTQRQIRLNFQGGVQQ